MLFAEFQSVVSDFSPASLIDDPVCFTFQEFELDQRRPILVVRSEFLFNGALSNHIIIRPGHQQEWCSITLIPFDMSFSSTQGA
jgi:hypothetical protein